MWHPLTIALDPTTVTGIPVVTTTTITTIGVGMVDMAAVAPISRVHTVAAVIVDQKGL